jgi:general stress protein 26
MKDLIAERAQDLETLRGWIRNIPIVVFTTITLEGHLRCRPFSTKFTGLKEDHWLFVRNDFEQLKDIQSNQEVSLSYNTSSNGQVCISGKGTIYQGRVLETFFHNRRQKPEPFEDVRYQNHSLISIDIETAEHWNSDLTKSIRLQSFSRTTVENDLYMV